MKKKLLSGAIIATIAIAGGCQAADEGAAPNRNGDQTSYGYGTDVNSGEGTLNVRNHVLERDADRFQNRRNNIDGVNYNRNLDGANNDFFNRTNNRQNNGVNQVRNNRNETRYEVSSEAADKISERVDEIDNVYVLTTDNNAYVAAELDTDRGDRNNRGNDTNNENRLNDELSDDVKQEIAKIVKSVDRNIDNVYVSTNPDFFDLSNNYANDLDRGEPVRGFFDQFSNMIERLFPENQTR